MIRQDYSSDLFIEKLYTLSMKHHFYLHGHINKRGEQQIYLSVTINRKRDRIPLKLYTSANNWNSERGRLINDFDNINLILDNHEAKAVEIKTYFFISKKALDVVSFKREFFSKTPSYDFISFMEVELEKQGYIPSTKRHVKGVVSKLKRYKEKIPFTELDLRFFDHYRGYLKKLGNKSTTINTNIKRIKKYLKLANKYGVYLGFDIDDIKVGSTKGNRINLNIQEVASLRKYYYSEFISEHLKLCLGYFLFSCNTGLRISDVKNLRRNQLLDDSFEFTSVKTKKRQVLKINNTCRKILDYKPELFIDFPTDQSINENLKTIQRACGIKKTLTFHVARHSFATNFLRKGGKVEELQKLLGHRSIVHTMIYVHIVEEEAIDSIDLLDDED